eukprot:SRR837773.24929.p2 GENE.SRR837773.24929~~SRR837773.24929.p2  ORF type:complete len:135 (+),score=55.15 SRR837773.24929:206-610(+)
MQDLAALTAEDAIFHPPPYFKFYRGQPMVVGILSEVLKVFDDSFVYHQQFVDSTKTNVVLEFSALLHGLVPVTGVDIIKFGAVKDPKTGAVEHKIVDFKVLLRPAEALVYLRRHMTSRMKEVMGGHLQKATAKL